MICKNCGKSLPNQVGGCPNCGTSIISLNFQNNRLGENGKRAEYVTEKYNMKKGIYEGKNKDINKTYIGVIFIVIVILIIITIAVANYLV